MFQEIFETDFVRKVQYLRYMYINSFELRIVNLLNNQH